jgi:hypothetical protein
VSQPRRGNRKPLATLLAAIFCVALLMGPGPGLYLVNPDPGEPSAEALILGMPVVYAWCVLWFLVQAGVVLAAYFYLWDKKEQLPPAAPCREAASGPKRGEEDG